MINQTTPAVVLRIPGPWRHVDDLARDLPAGSRLEEERLTLPMGPSLRFELRPADDTLPGIFRQQAPRAARAEELRRVDGARGIACLAGPGGSLDGARLMMASSAGLVARAGSGVFIDNSGLTHGASDWLELCRELNDPLALCDGYVLFFRLPSRPIFSHGMHVFGCRDVIIEADGEPDSRLGAVQDFARQSVATQKNWTAGERFRDIEGRPYRLKESDAVAAGFIGPSHPMFNPYGCWRLVPL